MAILGSTAYTVALVMRWNLRLDLYHVRKASWLSCYRALSKHWLQIPSPLMSGPIQRNGRALKRDNYHKVAFTKPLKMCPAASEEVHLSSFMRLRRPVITRQGSQWPKMGRSDCSRVQPFRVIQQNILAAVSYQLTSSIAEARWGLLDNCNSIWRSRVRTPSHATRSGSTHIRRQT